jgi:hypothetical protein
LDELLVAQGVLSRDKADELLASAETSDEPFATAVLESGVLTAWDLARTIAIHYQMPVHPLAGYRFDKELMRGIRPATLFRHQVVPVGLFGATRTFAVIEPPSRALLDELVACCGHSIFFFVAEAPEVARLLADNVKMVDPNADGGWKRLFDDAEEEITKGIAPTPAPRPATRS